MTPGGRCCRVGHRGRPVDEAARSARVSSTFSREAPEGGSSYPLVIVAEVERSRLRLRMGLCPDRLPGLLECPRHRRGVPEPCRITQVDVSEAA